MVMKIKTKLFFKILFIVSLFCSSSFAREENHNDLTILSASSFTNPLIELIRIYSRESNTTINTSFDDPKEQETKIIDGEDADIFISSNPTIINNLKQKGLVDVFSITNLAYNRLALVSSNQRIINNIKKDDNLLRKILYIQNKSLIIIADPDESTLGKYTKKSLMTLEEKYHYPIWNKIKNHLVRAYDSKDALYLITHGNGSGIVYYTDAYNNKEVTILNLFDAIKSEPITYQAVVIAGENMNKAREFIKFLKSKTTKNILTKYGFTPIEN